MKLNSLFRAIQRTYAAGEARFWEGSVRASPGRPDLNRDTDLKSSRPPSIVNAPPGSVSDLSPKQVSHAHALSADLTVERASLATAHARQLKETNLCPEGTE
jgi:hypothetical protein